MEGGVNPKKMARSKRASSQRSKAKHSKHGHAHAGAVLREKTVSEESLPSNWERYEDDSGSDKNLPPMAEGEVRPKSKGADYRELLSSDVPKLYEETPEMEGLTALLLANGLGLWDWDSSYLEPTSLSEERQVAREASALLTVDLRSLGKSLARLNVAQRLFLEDELFPNQNQEDEHDVVDSSTRLLDSEAATTPLKDELVQDRHDLSKDNSFRSGHADNAKSPLSVFTSDRPGLDCGESVSPAFSDTSPRGTYGIKSLSGNSGDLMTSSPLTLSNVRERTPKVKAQMRTWNSKEEDKRFEPTAAEAELDDLLDMLDNEVASISVKKGNEEKLPRSSKSESSAFQSSHPSSSWPSNIAFQESRVEIRPREMIPEPVIETVPKYSKAGSDSAIELKKNEVDGAKSTDVLLSQEDDFDSWLDSI